MTPQIAFDLSHDGIAMLSRAPDGRWWREGRVRLDDPEIGAALTKLRETAVERAGSDFASILILPDEQLLFTSLERDDRDPQVTIRSGLRGRTPYEVDELVFDHETRGDRLQVAVAARETLSEAEAFAEKFKFRPVAIVGNPGDVPYDGIPFFERTENSRLYMDGTRLELALNRGFEIDPEGPPPEVAPTFSHAGTGGDFAETRAETPAPDPEGGLARLAPRLHAVPVEPEDGKDEEAAAAGPDRPAPPRRKDRTRRAPAPEVATAGPQGADMALPGLAREQATQHEGGRARLGLWMTLSLLTALVAVGLWSMLSGPRGDDPAPIAISGPSTEPTPSERAETPRPSGPRADADPAALLPEAGSRRGLTTAQVPTPVTVTPEAAAPVATASATSGGAEAAAPQDPLVRIAAPPALPEQAPTLRLAAINPVRMGQDAVSLPRAALPQDGFAPQPAPPGPGEAFAVDEESGLVTPSAEGTPAPGGYTVLQGRPDVMPRPRPEPDEAQQAALTAEAQAEQEILRRIRPIRRPDDLPLAASEADQTTPDETGPDETGPDGPALAEANPATPEPETAADDTVGNEVAEAAILAAQQAAAASLARRDDDLAQIASAMQAQDGPVSALALAQSTRPRLRSQEAASAAAARAAQRQQQVAAAATSGTSTQTAAGSSPQIRSAGGSVSRAATDENILRLNQLNLIGVYGRPQDRRALVRLKNGRYVKVEVGDRLDRGRVTAIGEGELRYQRGGRNMVLRMPPV